MNEDVKKYRKQVKAELLAYKFAEGHYTEAEASEAVAMMSDDDLLKEMDMGTSPKEMANFIAQYF